MLCDGLKAHVDRLQKFEEFPPDGGIPKFPKTHFAFLKEQTTSTFYLATSVLKLQCAAETSSTELRFAEARVF